MDFIKQITARLDVLASELEKDKPDMALAIDLISDRMEKMAAIPESIQKMHKEYKEAGGSCNLSGFMNDIAGFLKFKKFDGKDIAEWDKTKGPQSK